MFMGKTLFDKVWDNHVVHTIPDGPQVIYIDKHFIHEVTTPQAFSGLRKRGIPVFRTENTVATVDHNIPTINQHLPIQEALSRHQVDTLVKNCDELDRKSTRLNSSHVRISYAVFCLKKKNQ